ncbi:MAG: hypothetical protein LBF38_09575 [Deltaproteobacteria bacterium]|jgi:hypothetical protein|nr:hypothetical protein [Deltaproteobacteria bacterium]
METIKEIAMAIGEALFWFIAVTGLLWLLSGGVVMAKENPPDRVIIGEQTIQLLQPDGLVKVNGLNPEADEFIESLKKRFKLNVLAIYANEREWNIFVKGLSKGQPRMVPTLAIISSTTRMEKENYDKKGVVKECKHLNNMVSLAINTLPISVLMSKKANEKITEKIGTDVGFSYAINKDVGRYAQDDRSISFALMTSVNLHGLRTDSFVTASALNIGNKFVFLTWFNPDRSRTGIDELKSKSATWLNQMASLNK